MHAGKRKQGESEAMYLAKNIICGSGAGMIAELITLPVDTAKVRLQIQ
jgi:hypothetical protein